VVLTVPRGSAVRGAPPSGARRLRAEDRGSQTLELALLLPVLALLVVALLQAGLAASELVIAQAAARDGARVAAVDDDRAARAAAEAVAGDRRISVATTPSAGARRPGDLVTVRVAMRSAVLDRLGIEAWLPASATMRTEGP
jgi:Flp pilus assembly protein TadG